MVFRAARCCSENEYRRAGTTRQAEEPTHGQKMPQTISSHRSAIIMSCMSLYPSRARFCPATCIYRRFILDPEMQHTRYRVGGHHIEESAFTTPHMGVSTTNDITTRTDTSPCAARTLPTCPPVHVAAGQRHLPHGHYRRPDMAPTSRTTPPPVRQR